MYPRYVEEKLKATRQDTPIIFIAGPRQCGKTTLVKRLISGETCTYVTLDDINQLKLAKNDPIQYIRGFGEKPVIIDEIQRAPELFLPIKQSVDEHRSPGRFLLTGSVNALTLPSVTDSLAGRLEFISLMPLAECEILNTPSTFLEKIFSGVLPQAQQTRIRERLIQKVLTGGFPEPLGREPGPRRTSWFNQYILSIIRKDLKNLGDIEHVNLMPRLIQMICNHAGRLINYTEISNSLGISRQTTAKYIQLLEQLFIFQELPAWHRNENKRLTKTPKAHLVDSGLLCALRRINEEKLRRDPLLLGNLLENYILCELRRLASWHDEPLYFSHYRDKDQVEVDIVLETMSGEVVGIEVKASATLGRNDFKGLERLKNAAKDQFRAGILLYDGDHANTVADNIFSAPIGSLWE